MSQSKLPPVTGSYDLPPVPADAARDSGLGELPIPSSKEVVNRQEVEPEQGDFEARQRSALAQELHALKLKAFELSQTRARIPQPLFWSLFNSKLKDIKQRKALERNVKELLGRLS
jgi:hypothetical protein